MQSIREYAGPIHLCTDCGQPCYDEESEEYDGPMHFSQQWDGIHCPRFPLASGRIRMKWDEESLNDLKATYPDTYPRWPSQAAATRLAQ